jgi:hypothetical protein
MPIQTPVVPLRVIIVCGGCNSGKSRTLRVLRDDYLRSRDGSLRFRRRLVNMEIRSLQEQCGTCDDEGRRCVIEKLRLWVNAARANHAILLIIPFTMKHDGRGGTLNEACIRPPIQWLESRRVRHNLVYLRREYGGPTMNDDYDGLMRVYFDRIIESRREGERVQARKLFQFIRSVT